MVFICHKKILPLRKDFFVSRSFCLGKGLETSGADLHPFAVDFLCLKIDSEFSKRGDIGMAPFVSAPGSAFANFTYSAHIHVYMLAYKHISKAGLNLSVDMLKC